MQRYGGISRIFSELWLRLNTEADQADITTLCTENVHLLDSGFPQKIKLPEGLPMKRPFRKAVNWLYSLQKMATSDYDIYHPTYYRLYRNAVTRKRPVVVTFHDMIHERYGDRYPELRADRFLPRLKKVAAEDAAALIAVSENTKSDVVNLLGVVPEKVLVVPLSHSFATALGQFEEDTANPYILFVGNRAFYKNFLFLLKACHALLKSRQLRLICAGGGPFTEQEKGEISRLKVANLVFHHSINDQSLAKLYAEASAFIFPSLYEGFGIPVLEAFACGCPSVLSNAGSLPEVGGDAALFFEPAEQDSLAAALERICSDSLLRESLRHAGRQRAALFSWDRTAQKTRDVYSSVL